MHRSLPVRLLLVAVSALSFAGPARAQVCLVDALPADFAAGTNAGTAADADVRLAPGVDESFADPGLPAGWSMTPWNSGGTGAAVLGALVVDGALVVTDEDYAAGRTLEFSATFAAEPFQHVGLAVDLNAPPWAIFSTGVGGGTLSARTHDGIVSTDTEIPLADPFAPHQFRIGWSPTEVQFYVDGALVATHAIAIATPMSVAASDYNVTATGVSVDSVQMSPPHVPAGTFSSRIGDSGGVSTWGVADWTSDTPAATSLAISVRTGDTPTPDGSWSAFAPIALSGDSVGQVGRYAQYRAELATGDAELTPRLVELSLACDVISVCGDGLVQGAEECDDSNTSPGDGCSATCQYEGADADGDGILNIHESDTGIYVSPTDTGTDPLDPDSDADGYCDGSSSPGGCIAGDNCPVAANGDQLDVDADTLGDVCDACPLDAANDADADTVCGNVDNCPLAANTDQLDGDADLRGDVCDNCAAIANPTQQNADADTLGDACDACPLDAANDADSDLVCGDVDNCPVLANLDQLDADVDTLGDVCDACPLDAANDADADTVCGNVDNCPLAANLGQENSDADALGNVCDACPLDAANDVDVDTVCGDVDNCPIAANTDQLDADADLRGDVCDNCAAIGNPAQENADADALGDACDACPVDVANDADADTICGDVDNCPTLANLDQLDADVDTLGDVCDACPLDAVNDADADTVCGNVDNCPLVANLNQLDADVDTLGDVCDACPLDAANDADADTLCGDVDNCPIAANTDQLDGDADLRGDVCDNCAAIANPAQENGDADALGDACDACPLDAANDADADTICGDVDNCPAVANLGQEDLDADEVGDVCDNCRYVANSGQADTGGVFASGPDGIGNICQCGDVTDAVQAGFDGAVSSFDVGEVRLYLAGASTLPASAILERCAVDGVTGACTVLEWVLLAQAEALVEPLPVAQVCRPAVCLIDPSDLDGDCLLGAGDLCLGWPNSGAEQATDANLDSVPDTCQCGDVDRDGDVDLDDETRLGACVEEQSFCDPSLADFDRDGDVDIVDLSIYVIARDAETLSALECTRRFGPAGP